MYQELCGLCDVNVGGFVECVGCKRRSLCVDCSGGDLLCVECSTELKLSKISQVYRPLTPCWFCKSDTQEEEWCKTCNAFQCKECSRGYPYQRKDCPDHQFNCKNCDTFFQQSMHPCSVKGCKGNVCSKCGLFGNASFYCNEHSKRCCLCSVLKK